MGKAKQSMPRIGLALGGGGARGWAHLGVMKALREQGVEVECVAGTSMGALVGAFVAARREQVLYDTAMQLNWKQVRHYLWEISLSRSGLSDGRRLLREAEKLLGLKEFRKLHLPFRAVATDLKTGEEIVLDSGNLLAAIRASISIPGLFSPVKIGRRLLVDGGLINPVPVDAVRAMGADVVLAVDVSQGVEADESLQQALPPVRRARAAAKGRGRTQRLRLPPEAGVKEEQSILQTVENFWTEIEEKAKRVYAATKGPSMMDILVRSVRITEAQLALLRRHTASPDILVEVPVGHIGTLEFHHAPAVIEIGYAATLQALNDYRAKAREG